MESESTTMTTTTAQRGNGGTPPAKPGQSTDGATEQIPEEFDGQPPEMCDVSDEECEMPEMPEGGESMMMGGPGGGRGEMMMQDVNNDSILHPVAYLALGGCSVVLGIVISYACFSKFFHDKPGKTFNTLAKFIWFIVVALVLAAGLIALCYFVPIWTR